MSNFPAFINPESSIAGGDFGGLVHREIVLLPMTDRDDDDHEGILILLRKIFATRRSPPVFSLELPNY
jgi:hypothetical protein